MLVRSWNPTRIFECICDYDVTFLIPVAWR
jgi:hypothetical protein